MVDANEDGKIAMDQFVRALFGPWKESELYPADRLMGFAAQRTAGDAQIQAKVGLHCTLRYCAARRRF